MVPKTDTCPRCRSRSERLLRTASGQHVYVCSSCWFVFLETPLVTQDYLGMSVSLWEWRPVEGRELAALWELAEERNEELYRALLARGL